MAAYQAHETAVIDPGCTIGEGTRIWHFSHIMTGCTIGRNCNIGQNVVISPKVVLGNNVKVQNNVSVYTGVTCGDDVFLGPSCVFTNVVNPRSAVSRKDRYLETHVGKGASIGANATIVCGHTVGEYAMIGAGAVVTKDIPDYCVAGGVPAYIIRYKCTPEEASKMNEIAWWDWDESIIEERKDNFRLSIPDFIYKYKK